MNFKLILSKTKINWLEQAFLSTNKAKDDIVVLLEQYADLIYSGVFTVGQNGIVCMLTKNNRTAYVVDAYGADIIIEIIEAEPPQTNLKWVKVSAPNSLKLKITSVQI